MNDREPDAAAGKFAMTMQALKHSKQSVGVAAVETDAVIDHLINNTIYFLATLHDDFRLRRLAAVFDRVVEQVGPDLQDQSLIAARGRQCADDDFGRAGA